MRSTFPRGRCCKRKGQTAHALEDGKDKVQLVLTKNWADFNNQFGTRPDTLDLTLKRRADAQPGQSNAIDWTTVTDSTPTEDKSVINQWKYIWSGFPMLPNWTLPFPDA